MGLNYRKGRWSGQRGYYIRLGDETKAVVDALRGAEPATTYITRLVMRAIASERRKKVETV